MSIIESFTLFGIMLALAAMPSISVALVVTRSACLGTANGIAVASGIVLGDLVFIIFVTFGLSSIAKSMGGLFMILKFLGGLYLLWLGFSLLFTKNRTITVKNTNNKNSLLVSFMAGLLLTLGDSKAIVFYASLLPVFIDLSTVATVEILKIVFITIFSVGGVKTIYALFANKIVAYAEAKPTQTAARKIAGGLMIGASTLSMLY